MASSEGWSIQPEQVATVLTAVNGKAELMGAALATMQADVSSAAAATGNSAAISQALMDFFAQEGPRLEGVSKRIAASLTGASDATSAYVKGDYEMASSSQSLQVELINNPVLPGNGAY
ncbi:MAG: DUF6507 family protein [Microterricola sp.]